MGVGMNLQVWPPLEPDKTPGDGRLQGYIDGFLAGRNLPR